MVKFRCTFCTQKIAVNDEGIGAPIDCPTCKQQLIVPKETSLEFQGQVVLYASRPAPEITEAASHPRAALVPQLGRMLMDKLTQALLSQRRQLMQTQAVGTQQLVEFEQRIVRLHDQYRAQVKELDRQLAMRDEEIQLLRKENAALARRAEQSPAQNAPRVELRDVGFLLRT